MIARTPPSPKLRVAVPKGALFDHSVRALVAGGLDVGGLAEPGRRLMVESTDAVFVIGRPTDIPVYAAYGGVDCAIAGKDVLVEADLDVVELVDLGFGACRFVVAGPAGSEDDIAEHYGHVGVMRVATKYPRIAQAHFDERGVQVEIVKLHGNIELAPAIGLAERVVDITATGRTLAENGLRVFDEAMTSTARFIGNPVSLRTDPRVTELADRLSAVSVE